MIIAMACMPQNVPGYAYNFPTGDFLKFINSLLSNSQSNEGFALYLLTWLGLLAVCIYLLASTATAKVPFAVPTLVGLFSAAFHFVAKLAGTLYHRSIWEPA